MTSRTLPTVADWFDEQIPNYAYLNKYLSTVQEFVMNPPLLRIRQQTAQTLASGSLVPINWDLLEVETDDFWASTTPSIIKPSIPGWYFGSVKGSWTGNAAGYRQVEVTKNGATKTTKFQGAAINSLSMSYQGSFIESFNGTTDNIVVGFFQNSGVSLTTDINTMSGSPSVTLRWLAAL